MEGEERYIASNPDTPVVPDLHVQDPRSDLASRDAEIRTLRETVDVLFEHLAQWDQQLRGRLRELQGQMATLEAEREAVHQTSASTEPIPYRDLIGHIRHIVDETLPAQASVLVVSRGDSTLLSLKGRRGGHFPQQEDGVYAGYYPADSTAAIAHLEELRAKGAEYLLIPQTSLWWLTYYEAFAQHVQSHYDVIVRQDDTCWIIDLKQSSQPGASASVLSSSQGRGYRAVKEQISELVSVLLPADTCVLVVSKGDDKLVRRCGAKAQHFPQDADGGYAGYYPASSEDAIAHLEDLQQQGADFLLFPRTAFWWLDYYRAFRAHLEERYRVVCWQQHLCLIFDLTRRPPQDRPSRLDLHRRKNHG